MKYGTIIHKLNSFKKLENNWDGRGAKKFDASYIEYVNKCIPQLNYAREIFPLPNGTVVVTVDKQEHKKQLKYYIEMNFHKDFNIEISVVDSEYNEYDYLVNKDDIGKVNEILQKYMEGK